MADPSSSPLSAYPSSPTPYHGDSRILPNIPEGHSSPLSALRTSPLSALRTPFTKAPTITMTPRRSRPRSNSDFTLTPHARVVLNVTPHRNSPNQPPAALPPLELSPGFIMQSPIRGTAANKKAARMKEGQEKRAETMAEKIAAAERDHFMEEEEQQRRNQETFRRCLELLRSKGTTFGEFLMYVLDPKSGEGVVRWHEFAAVSGRITQILDWWSSGKNPRRVRDELDEWAVEHVCSLLAKQARHVTRMGKLKTWGRDIDEKLVLTFSFQTLYQYLRNEGADLIVRVFESIAHSKDTPNHSEARNLRTETVVTSTILQCLAEHNNGNNLSRRMMGLYLYASESYTSIVQNDSHMADESTLSSLNPIPVQPLSDGPPSASVQPLSNDPPSDIPTQPFPNQPTSKRHRIGTLQKLSASIRTKARGVATVGLFGEVYDNINFMSRTGEQALGHHDSQENGTCVTVFELWAVKIEDLQSSVLQEAFDNALPLTKEDILHNPTESALFRKCLIHGLICIIIRYSQQEKLQAFRSDMEKRQPYSNIRITPHHTKVYPVTAFNIDESSITGNVDADEAVVDILELRKRVTRFWERVRIIAGDQLSIARLRSIQLLRAGHEGGYEGFGWGVWMPGLFHAKMTDIHGLMTTHFGNPSASIADPGSLHFHNTLLGRLPIVPTSLPPFHTCRNLVFVSLYARALHCLLLVSGKSSLEEYAESLSSWDQLYSDAERIYDTYANAAVVGELREARELAEEGEAEGDMVFENAVLFLRDALISREMADAVRAGDSGRVVLVLKIWALSFRGSGRTKYAYEMLYLIHNLEKVWPKPIRDAVLNNWLVSTNGRTFLEVDLLQEHLNYWIKVFYKAHGSNMSWQWLGMIAPCVNILRALAAQIHDILGYDQYLRHAEVDISNDIFGLMDSLDNREVYKTTKGRKLGEDQIVLDNVGFGLQVYTTGNHNPLHEFNEMASQLQRRRRMAPLDVDEEITPPTHTSYSPNSTAPLNHSNGATTASQGNNTDPDEPEDQYVGELAEILDALDRGEVEPTLVLAGADDVALDFEDVGQMGIGADADELFEDFDRDPEPEPVEVEADMWAL
ncbi:hypothetical protein BT96DRAFT_1007024 [Gymnopus androsaceus JB14]|uniref:DUF6589 domain-containing protein n=1 Tax=Gymnopus androsaceus JB14 TaxID=1447944 RepID=A0A6A4GIP8_9AGAR|nr:hypothetical protein BT96DRAFT_1007024 [Gymnopus androsaceus JB14]